MKECDIFRGSSYIFSGVRTSPNPPGSMPLLLTLEDTMNVLLTLSDPRQWGQWADADCLETLNNWSL